MEVVATVKFAKISPKKVRPLLGDLRRRSAAAVLDSLRYARTKGGKLVYKLIASAMANAANNYNAKPENLRIKSLVVDDGPRYKRYWLRSHGAADVRLKRTAHLAVVLEEILPSKDLPKSTAKTIAKSAAPVKTEGAMKSKPAAETPPTTGPAAKPESLGKPKGRFGGKRLFPRTTNK